MGVKEKPLTFTTEEGELSWPYLDRTEEWDGKDTGKHSITIKFNHEYTQQFLGILEAEYERLLTTDEKLKALKVKKGSCPSFGDKEDKNGDTVFKFTTMATYTNGKTGEKVKRTIPIVDSMGKKINPKIGNGTRGRLNISVIPKTQSTTNYGVSLWFNGIQVTQLVEYGSQGDSAEALGFGVVEGGYVGSNYNQEDNSGEEEENVFATAPTGSTEGVKAGDF